MKALALLVGLGVVFALSRAAYAQSLISPNYEMDQSFIGAGGLIEESSPNYGLRESIGDTGTGLSQSPNYRTDAGYTTTGAPALSVNVTDPVVDFGALSPTEAKTDTAGFSVSNYTSYGYVININGNTLTQGSETIDALSTAGTSTTGTKQFGLNLAANTSPTTVGADPAGGSGVAEDPDYDLDGTFKFDNGDLIASAPETSENTDFTITYLANVSGQTVAGQYTAIHTIVVTGTY